VGTTRAEAVIADLIDNHARVAAADSTAIKAVPHADNREQQTGGSGQ
jgi:hypothetical protein